MESYYSSAAIAYPDDHQQYNPAASYSALEEIGYPYPTFEDPSILFEKIGQVGEGTYG
jgi:CTD kinase subunit alpha